MNELIISDKHNILVQAYLVLLHFTLQCFANIALFTMEGLWQSFISKSVSAISPTVCVHFLSLHHIFVILITFQTLRLSMIGDHCYCCNCFGAPRTVPRNLIDKCCMCSNCSTNWPFPVLSLYLWPSLFSETQQY